MVLEITRVVASHGHINVSILSISSSILYGGFNTRRYMFVQCFCLYMGGMERVKNPQVYIIYTG